MKGSLWPLNLYHRPCSLVLTCHANPTSATRLRGHQQNIKRAARAQGSAVNQEPVKVRAAPVSSELPVREEKTRSGVNMSSGGSASILQERRR